MPNETAPERSALSPSKSVLGWTVSSEFGCEELFVCDDNELEDDPWLLEELEDELLVIEDEVISEVPSTDDDDKTELVVEVLLVSLPEDNDGLEIPPGGRIVMHDDNINADRAVISDFFILNLLLSIIYCF
jgi:hypothetical protein